MKNIKFTYIGEYFYEVCEHPQPSSAFIPDWYRTMPEYQGYNNKLTILNNNSNATAKKCIPMLDEIITGYTVPLWADVQVQQIPESPPMLSWRVSEQVFDMNGPSSALIPPPPGFSNNVFKFVSGFRIQTPPGYSIMVKQPSGHYDLPFHVIPAIVDTDKSVIENNFPMWVEEGFEGIVEKGTPMVQIVPFKRDDWKSEIDWITFDQFNIDRDRGYRSTIRNNYSKNIWSKKRFK